jgi:AraC-like DNA-binding protein
MCGMVRRNPNSSPEAHSTALFGPGDTVPTNANASSATSWFTNGPRGIESASRPSKTQTARGVLYDFPVLDAPHEWVRAWKPAVPGIHEVFHARFVDHVYPRHTHDTWTVFILDEGAIAYDLETKHRGAAGARVTILPPHVVHDGRAAGEMGYRKRVLYLGTDVLHERLIGRAVDDPDIEDRAIFGGLRSLHRVLSDPGETLEAEAMLAVVSLKLEEHLGGGVAEHVERPDDDVAADLRDLLDQHRFEPLTLADAGQILHVSRAHLVRCFTRTFGIAPHRYVLARRIDAARQRLLDGEPIAQVATGVGFHDQAHLTRHFRRHVGTTPARYASRT